MENLFILISSDGLSVSPDKLVTLDKNHLLITLILENSGIQTLNVIYNNSEQSINFENTDIELPMVDKMKSIYQNLIAKYPRLLVELKNLPGQDEYQKFYHYYLTGISLILSLFGLIQTNDKLISPVSLVFPDFGVNINILNPKFYNFFNHYLKILKFDDLRDKILVEWMTFISDFWNIFGETFLEGLTTSEKEYQNVMAAYSAILGYSSFLETELVKSKQYLDLQRLELTQIKVNKAQEITQFYDNEILGVAVKTAEIRNSHQDLINETKDLIVYTRNELESHNKKLFDSNLAISKKKLEDFINDKRNALTQEYSFTIKKHITEMETNILAIENKQTTKIRNSVNELTDKKNGLLHEIDKKRSEALESFKTERDSTIKEIKESTQTSLDSLKSIQDGLKQMNREITEKLTNFETEIDTKFDALNGLNTRVEEKIEQLKHYEDLNIENYLKSIEPKIKSHSEIIIQKAFNDVLGKVVPNLEQAISKIIANKLSEGLGK